MDPPGESDKALPGFQPASALPRSTHAPSANSHRNASGGLPPLPPGPSPLPPKTSTETTSSAAPLKPVHRPATSKNAIVHSVLQRRNPILPLIRNVGLEIGDIVADYQVGAHTGVLFLSLKYHRLHPEYIFGRIEKMRNVYNLRILLVLCDVNEHQQPLRELSKVAVVNDLTLIVAFSNEEAAQYLTTYKAYEHKSADSLKERVRQSYPDQLEHVLTSGRKVNKANAETLAATFGSFANMVRQSSAVLTGVKGIGPTKTLSLYRAFNEPFVAGGRKKPTAAEKVSVAEALETQSSDPAEDEVVVAEGDPMSALASGSPVLPLPDSPPGEAASLKRPPTPRRPDNNSPSRSPSVGPDEEHTATTEVWHDPLEDDDDDDSEDKDEDERPSKRARV